MIERREMILALAGAGLAAGLSAAAGLARAKPDPAVLSRRLQSLEARSGGRLGVSIIDTGGGLRLRHRSQERFPMCSAFKVLAAACVLARVDGGQETLGRRIAYDASELIFYSPATKPHAGAGMTLGELCEAAVTLSDNTAANLVLKQIGGPKGLTAWLRSIGDATTRLDRWEPELNTAIPGDPRDTTTPDAMAETLRSLVLRRALSDESRAILAGWMVACQTGGARLRAGLPAGWRVGDKTGTSADKAGTSNDVALVWRPDGRTAVITAFLTRATPDGKARDAILAEVGKIAAESLA
ncbi:class A beta-lactamase [Phenylobacterium sp.]|uniref:class A beta-lactamase n=1 Tax=Phenylobacterium sp. TaxID=1871053 RepID=UPI0035B4507B